MLCFTIADSQYAAKVSVLAESLNFWHPEIRLICFATDGHGAEAYGPNAHMEVRSLPEEEWVKNDPALASRLVDLEGLARGSYFKPMVLRHLLLKSLEPVIFLDPDLWLTGAIPELFSLAGGREWPSWLERGELLLTPHLMSPMVTPNRVERELNILVSGTFNAGLIAGRPTPAVVAFVQWWAGRVQELNCHDQAAGLFWDQKWLDFAPVHVAATWIIRDPGINLGHWRLPEAPPVGQCRLLHMSGFEPQEPVTISRYTLHTDLRELPEDYRALFSRYGRLLQNQANSSALSPPAQLAPLAWRASPQASPDDPGRTAFVTAAAKSEWALVRTLWESFHRHHPGIPFFALLTDEPDGLFDPEQEPFEVLRLDDLELDDKAELVRSMDRMEFTYALTPALLLAIHRKGFGRACFLKQESLVVASMLEVVNQLAGCSILLTPHLPAALSGEVGFSREANILQSGIYNVGFIGVRDTEQGREFWSGGETAFISIAAEMLRKVPTLSSVGSTWCLATLRMLTSSGTGDLISVIGTFRSWLLIFAMDAFPIRVGCAASSG